MPTAATPSASVRRSSSCFVSNRMHSSILGVEVKRGGEERCDGHHANGDWTRWGVQQLMMSQIQRWSPYLGTAQCYDAALEMEPRT